MKLRDAIKVQGEDGEKTKPEEEDTAPKVDEDQKLLAEMEELKERMEANKKRAKKLAAKKKAKVCYQHHILNGRAASSTCLIIWTIIRVE